MDQEKRKEYQKRWRKAHKEEMQQYQKRYQREKAEQIAEQRRAYYLANREQIIEKVKARYEENPKAVIERAKKWNKENRDAHRAADKKWSSANKAKKNSASRRSHERHLEDYKRRLAEWRKRNPLLVRANTQKRRARIMGSGGEITAEQVEALYKKQYGKCAACKKELNMQYHLDHVMPLSLGGKHEIENAQILCRKCNQMKHAMHPDAWAARIGKLFV